MIPLEHIFPAEFDLGEPVAYLWFIAFPFLTLVAVYFWDSALASLIPYTEHT